MAEDEAQQRVPEAASDYLLPPEGPEPTVAVGGSEPLTIVEQMDQLSRLLREFGQTCRGSIAVEEHKDPYYAAEKALFRCVDILQRYVDDH